MYILYQLFQGCMHLIGNKMRAGIALSHFPFFLLMSRFFSLIKQFYIYIINRVICGITEDTQQYHIIRAALEAVCFQTRDILEAMVKDSGTNLTTLQVDGGMTVNDLLMQLQADLTGITVGKHTISV